MTRAPRVAFFTDSFHEVNGVALTSRQFDAYARRKRLPFFSVHAGPQTRFTTSDAACTYELKRGPASIPLDRDLFFDPLIMRFRTALAKALEAFQPDLIHVTGPGDMGLLGLTLARTFRVPLAASWHTNLHEFAARRLEKLLSFVPEGPRRMSSRLADQSSLGAVMWFYRKASVCLAPNQELIELVSRGTGKPTFLMQRGADTHLFSPAKRDPGSRPFTLGFVGRLQAEKNVRFLVKLEHALLAAGQRNFRFLVVGGGGEKQWLEENLKHAEFPGVLTGEALARAYANMDLFVFPSFTDTFGNVILEAMASGVPSVVTAGGGPKFLVQSGSTGFIAADDDSFIGCVLNILRDCDLHERMCSAARQASLSLSWDDTFDRVYQAYDVCWEGLDKALREAC